MVRRGEPHGRVLRPAHAQGAQYTEAARATAIQLRDTSLATTVLVTGLRATLFYAPPRTGAAARGTNCAVARDAEIQLPDVVVVLIFILY